MPQVYSAWHRVFRLSLPNGWLETTNVRNLPSQLKLLYEMVKGGPRVRRAAQARMVQQARRAKAAAAAPAGPGAPAAPAAPAPTREPTAA